MPTEIVAPKPSYKESGYVQGQIVDNTGTFSQWEQFERVPDLQWPHSVGVYTRMKREDSRVSSMLSAIGLPVRRTQWRVAAGPASPEVTSFVAQNLGLPIAGEENLPLPGRTRGRFSWSQHLEWALAVLPYGHSVFEQVYREGPDGRAWLHKLAPRPQRTISQWNVALDGGLDSIEQLAPASTGKVVYGPEPLEIPISRLVVYTLDMEPGQWVGNSLLRPSYKHWLLKDELIRIQAAAARRNGMGVPVGTAAEGAKQEDVDKMGAAASDFRGGEFNGLGIPYGAKMELLGVQGNLPDLQAGINYHDSMIAIAGLAHFLNLSGGGSYALASVQENTFVQSVQTFAEKIAATATSHIVEDLVDINFGVDEPAPRIVFDEIGARQDATAAALKMLVEAGLLSPDIFVEQAMRQKLGLPAKDPATPTVEPQKPGLAPVASKRGTANASQGALW